ncbi:hypothetical protein GA0115241_1016105, partial [Streptomyces sp. DpondAA-D4]|uniref:hypothetical protein n=1 Tax=Streptomyces sp. DpondAA-D4 TaxID=1839769 RepID=UPI00081B31B1
LAAAALFSPVVGQRSAHAEGTPLAGLEDLLYGAARLAPPRYDPTVESVATSLLTSRREFKTARYDTLAKA